ncbi:hypothetical protein SAMN05421819_4157 [Bryocella elongata]|uniref:Uncharacterized protein n=1 Tax=Bryocella elongata TaxID=863522 RepID=A0A1H6C1B4_9BACT|nr:hypothetical protein [Bryocella elongata]SEG66769.1 hypothetical protein SAMN05421819_4157 [Bryocella elongata]
MASTKNAGKYKKLDVIGGNKSITLYVGPKIHHSWDIVSEKLDLFAGAHLINLLEAAQEQGKRLGRAEVMEKMTSLQNEIDKEISKIEKTTNYKTPGRPKKNPKKK